MVGPHPSYKPNPMKHHKPVATWLLLKDVEMLQQLASKNNVSVAAYVRAIIVDALAEEELYSTKKSLASFGNNGALASLNK